MYKIIIILILIISSIACNEHRTNKIKLTSERKNKLDSLMLFDRQIIGVISVGSIKYRIYSGRKCELCEDPLSIFIISEKSDIINSEIIKNSEYSYPGNEFNYVGHQQISDIRTFWGNCTKKYNNSIIWYQKELMKNGEWITSFYIIQFFEDKIIKLSLKENEIDLTEIISNLKKEECLEIPGIDYTYEP